MNRRQKKKFWRSHVIVEDRMSGKRSIVKIQDIVKLATIAELTRDEFEAWINSDLEVLKRSGG